MVIGIFVGTIGDLLVTRYQLQKLPAGTIFEPRLVVPATRREARRAWFNTLWPIGVFGFYAVTTSGPAGVVSVVAYASWVVALCRSSVFVARMTSWRRRRFELLDPRKGMA